MAALSHTKTKDASTPNDESLLQKAARIIPGMGSSGGAPTKKPTRSRKAKMASISAPVQGTGVTIGKEGEPSSLAPPAQGAGQGAEEEGDELVEAKKTSAVEATSKRIRAANKKLQRIAAYEEKTEALNADQRTAVASKPALQAVVKELEELLVILKAEETEDDARNKRVAAQQEKKNARSLSLAVAEHQKATHSDLLVLLQFLHLHELYSPAEQRNFAPPPLPPIVANATGNEVGAVRCLREAFATAPLALGGYEEVKEKLSKLAQGSEEDVIPSVTYARVKELLDGLTPSADPTPATPIATSPTAPESSNPQTLPIPESSAPAGAADSVTALVDGATDSPARTPTGPSFLNASELEQVPSTDEKVADWAHEVTPAAPAPASEPSVQDIAAEADTWSAPPSQINGTPADWTNPSAGATAPIDWASEENHNELPSLPELAAQPTPAAAPPAAADGFQPARGGSRRGGPEGGRGGRGGFRGGEGRGSFRGGRGRGGYQGGERREGGGYQGGERREGADGQWQRGPREGGEFRGGRGGGEGGRGGRGGGRGRPEGRGGRGSFRGAPANGEAAAATATPAPAVL